MYSQLKQTLLDRIALSKRNFNIIDGVVYPPSYAQVVAGQTPHEIMKNAYFAQINTLSTKISGFKDIVFEILEAYHFCECSTFTDLLKKWDKYKDGMVTISPFFNMAEPVKRRKKLKYYIVVFDYLSRLNLIEFLAESIANGDLSEDFIYSLGNV